MNIKQLSDENLNLNLKSLIQKERQLLTEVLWHIREVDRRELYLSMGYCSLFAYLTEYLGYSAASSQRRIDASRLLQELPEISGMIESGKINLSQIALVQQSAREVKRVHRQKVASKLKKEILLQIQSQSKSQSQIVVAKAFELPAVCVSKVYHQADESIRVEMIFAPEQWQKIQEMQEILSNSVKSRDLSKVMNYLAEKVIQKEKGKSKYSARACANQIRTSAAEVEVVRPLLGVPIVASSAVAPSLLKATVKLAPIRFRREYLPAGIKRQVFSQYPTCQFRDAGSGKICGSRHYLQVDHVKPVWAGGSNVIENLTVLCGNHNRYQYRQQCGVRRV